MSDSHSDPADTSVTRATNLAAAQVRMLHDGLPAATIGNLLIGSITLWVLRSAVPFTLLWLWFAVLTIVQLARLGLWFISRGADIPESATSHRRLLRCCALLTGAAWGALPVVLFPADLPHQAFLPFVAAGVTGAAVATLAIDRASALSFVLAALVPLVIRLIYEGGEIRTAMGLMVLLYMGYLAAATGRAARSFARKQLLQQEAEQRDEHLRQSEQRWQFALEGSGDGVWDWNAQTNKVFYSRRWKEMLGYTESEIGDALVEWDSRVHPDDKASCYEDLERHFRGETPVYVNEHRVRCKDGSYKWILDRGQVIERTTDGKPLRVIGTHTDITERKRIERELLDSQTRYQQLIEEIGDKFVVYSHSPVDGALSYVSNGFEAVFGIPRTQALGRTWAELIDWLPGVVEQGRENVARLVEGRQQYAELDMSFNRPDGSVGTIHVTAHAVRDASGAVAGIDGIAEDITAAMEAKAQMRETTRLLDSVIENIPAMIFMKRASDLRFTLFNRAGEELTGISREELLGKNDFDFFPPEQAEFFTRKDRQVLEIGFQDIAEEPINTRQRGQRILHTRKVALYDEQNRPRFLLGISEDITEQKQAEAALHDSSERIRTIVDNVVDGIITIDEQGRIESYNAAAERIFGYGANEVIGRNVSMLMPEPYRSQHDLFVSNYVGGGTPRIIGVGREVVGLRKDGDSFPMDLAISEVWLGGRRIFTGLVRDITERRKVERLKREFISTVSHELRTPLTSIRGSLGLIAGGVAGPIPEKAKEMVDIAYRNSEQLSRLINDILDIEKIESGRMTFSMQSHPIKGLIERSLDAYRAYAEQRRVAFAVAGDIPDVEVRVDDERFMQIMANLLSNAVKFSPVGDVVEIAVSVNNSRMRVAVSDRGPGIPDEFRERIFEKFSQADASDSRHKGGSGLGLNITQMLVERMAGRIGYDSKAGSGTVFHVDFPIVDRSSGH